jgi:hypothetical protein
MSDPICISSAEDTDSDTDDEYWGPEPEKRGETKAFQRVL